MQIVEPDERFEAKFENAVRVSQMDLENYPEPLLLGEAIVNFASSKGSGKPINQKRILIQIGDYIDNQKAFFIQGLGEAIKKNKEKKEK